MRGPVQGFQNHQGPEVMNREARTDDCGDVRCVELLVEKKKEQHSIRLIRSMILALQPHLSSHRHGQIGL